MSHVVDIELEVKSIPDLKKACKKLGLTFKENKKTYEWWGRHEGDYPLPEGFTVDEMGKCDHAIQVPGAKWEIGVCKKGKNYKLIYDFYGGEGSKIEKVCGDRLGKLKQAYTIESIKSECERKKMKVKERILKPVAA